MSASPTIPTCACELGVVEFDAAGPVRAEQHPERQERDEHGHARARRSQRGERARSQDRADDEEGEPSSILVSCRAVRPRADGTPGRGGYEATPSD